MKVGSLVECVNNDGVDNGAIVPRLETPYTIREIRPYPGQLPGVLLEEIVNGGYPQRADIEVCYKIERFRELLPPMDSVEEFVNENTLELQEL